MNQEQVGFIGLGIMGLPMARNLLKGGLSDCGVQSLAGSRRSAGGRGRCGGRLAG